MSDNMKMKVLHIGRRIIPGEIRHKLSGAYKRSQVNISHVRHREAFNRKKTGKSTIVFLVCEPQSWNSLKSVYHAAEANEEINAILLLAPEEINGQWTIKEKTLSFFKSEASDVITGYQHDRCFDLSSVKPDVVFRQTPYDEAYPKEFSAASIARCAKTCYIPYGYNFSPNKHLGIEYNHPFVKDLYAVFTDCQSNFEYCEKLKENLYADLHVYYEGFPRIDLLRTAKDRRNKEQYTFTWIPRWSLDSVYNDPSGFFTYKEKLIAFFSEHTNCRLIIRPHPLMFPSFIKWGVMSEQEVAAFIEMIAKKPNIQLDQQFDYLYTFEETDALIADFSSLVYEFYLTGKPIIYCGSTSEYNRETRTMMDLLYKASDWETLKKHMELLVAGNDVLKDERRKDTQLVFDELPDNIGESIINRCVEFCRGENK